MIKEEATQMQWLINQPDYKDAHRRADKLLCLAIKKMAAKLNCMEDANELLNTYEMVERYYGL